MDQENSDGRGGRRSSNSVTIREVAERAGVSQMTVSNVLNGTINVRPTKKDAVLAAIRDLNYKPNRAARSLASADSARVGLLYGDPASEFLSSILVGVLEATDRLGSQLTIKRVPDFGAPTLRSTLVKLAEEGLTGVLIPAPMGDILAAEPGEKTLALPAVAISPGEALGDLPSMFSDQQQAAFDMTKLLIELGHRRIGFIRGPAGHSASAARFSGYQHALRAHGIKLDDSLISEGDFYYQSGLTAGAALFDCADPPTAIFASNDAMAAALISLAHRRHISVPEDLSIVGFDDAPIATTIWPELTTVRLPLAAMASSALECLVANLRSKSSPKEPLTHRMFPHEIIVRQSAAPPR